jgi:hypothetical protein
MNKTIVARTGNSMEHVNPGCSVNTPPEKYKKQALTSASEEKHIEKYAASTEESKKKLSGGDPNTDLGTQGQDTDKTRESRRKSQERNQGLLWLTEKS